MNRNSVIRNGAMRGSSQSSVSLINGNVITTLPVDMMGLSKKGSLESSVNQKCP